MDSGSVWPPSDQAAWNPGRRIYPRYTPSYSTKIVLERVNDNEPDYRFGGPVDTGYGPGRSTGPEEQYRPFDYINYYRPVTGPIPVIDTNSGPLPTTQLTGDWNAGASKIQTCVPKRFYGPRYRLLGYVIMILAILTFAFELADVIVAANYKSSPCNGQVVTNAFTVPWFFSWVASGLWGSIPIFISGILAMNVKSNYGRVFRALAIMSSLSALFFAPAIIAINAAEIATFLQYCGYTSIANIKSTSNETAKFALPIVLIILGSILFLLLLYLVYFLCKSYDECAPSETVVIGNKKTATSSPAIVPVQPMIPCPIPAVDYIPAPATLPPPPPRDMGAQGRVVFMEAHNRGYAYANVPGYFTSLPTTVPTPVAAPGFYWK